MREVDSVRAAGHNSGTRFANGIGFSCGEAQFCQCSEGGTTNQTTGANFDGKQLRYPSSVLDLVTELPVPGIFSDFGGFDPFFRWAGEFEKQNATGHPGPNHHVWSQVRRADERREHSFLVIEIDEQLPIICATKEALIDRLLLTCDRGVSGTNKGVQERIADCVCVMYRFFLIGVSD